MDRVRQALLKVLPAASQARRLGLMVYGPGPNTNTCKNVDLRLPPTSNAGSRIMQEVERLRPAGRTALTSSVQRAAEILHHEHRACRSRRADRRARYLRRGCLRACAPVESIYTPRSPSTSLDTGCGPGPERCCHSSSVAWPMRPAASTPRRKRPSNWPRFCPRPWAALR